MIKRVIVPAFAWLLPVGLFVVIVLAAARAEHPSTAPTPLPTPATPIVWPTP